MLAALIGGAESPFPSKYTALPARLGVVMAGSKNNKQPSSESPSGVRSAEPSIFIVVFVCRISCKKVSRP